MSGGNVRPPSSIFDIGKDSPAERLSLASKTMYEPPNGLNRKKSRFSWNNRKKEKERLDELKLIAIEEERNEAQRQLQQHMLEQKQRMDEIENENRRRRLEEADRQREADEQRRLAHEVKQAKKRTELEYAQRRIAEANMRRRTTTTEALRNLRELVRTRYELDNEIWRRRDIRGPMRPEIIKKMQRSDAVLAEIQAIVATWEESPGTWDKKEWELAAEVRDRLLAEGKRKWENNPPWIDN
jgi:hypothetical protein